VVVNLDRIKNASTLDSYIDKINFGILDNQKTALQILEIDKAYIIKFLKLMNRFGIPFKWNLSIAI